MASKSDTKVKRLLRAGNDEAAIYVELALQVDSAHGALVRLEGPFLYAHSPRVRQCLKQ